MPMLLLDFTSCAHDAAGMAMKETFESVHHPPQLLGEQLMLTDS